MAKNQYPSDNLQTGNPECQDESNFTTGNDTAGSAPVPDDHKKNNGSRNDRRPDQNHRNNRHKKSDLVIAHPMGFQVFYLAFDFSFFQASRTYMPVVQLNITQRT